MRGTRWLDEDEFVQLYKWLECRVEEMAQLHVDQPDADGRILDWSKTKNGKPHSLPVPDLAADLPASIEPNEHGWFSRRRRTRRGPSQPARSMPSCSGSAAAA